ncbi:MAG: ABC transporter permease [Dictyoglomus turgidum]|uniref:Binding-protein-dependent transport systems inner membrane component n=1 Tax=Dictyoglomus turgidum (strain DSM 6724 / Z-1310) TaxID=515635 RepID=B8E3C0_DICTD|nr:MULTISPECIES: ABC transporter permease [Dictyoglomus]ACK42994.1 binding-protein-dependent transport systems inner membrane component [Dictyoglomus turgidum DSM 6724]HBU31059.1 ABC transporter permease [Dictyoglomus sp.]
MLKRYLIPRFLQYLLVIFVGVTIVFFVPRFTPVDPVQQMISTIMKMGTYLDPKAVEQMTESLKELYGLKGSLFEQYINFWLRLFRGDFGPSLFRFPIPVIKLIGDSLPWTVGLLSVSTLLSWIIGNILGGIVGFYYDKRWARILEGIAMFIRPIPYYVFALIILVIFAYILKWFPLGGGMPIGVRPSFSLQFILELFRYAFLPLISMMILGIAVTLQTMRLIVSNVVKEDFVTYARAGGVKKRIITFKYVIRNAMLPQVTNLALSMGQIFSGALITEIVFSYPGMGTLLYNAIATGDFNLIMGIATISIVGISSFILIIDLLYPLFDPRVRYR